MCFALSITNSVQCISGTYSCTMMNPITFMSHISTVTASFWDKDGLSYTSAGVPDLPLLVFGILLQCRYISSCVKHLSHIRPTENFLFQINKCVCTMCPWYNICIHNKVHHGYTSIGYLNPDNVIPVASGSILVRAVSHLLLPWFRVTSLSKSIFFSKSWFSYMAGYRNRYDNGVTKAFKSTLMPQQGRQ